MLVFGDSIITESQKELLAELGPDFEVKYRTFGGTAPCDWSEAATKTISDDHPDVVVTSFLANNFTPCTTLATGDALGAIFSTHLTIIANAALAVHAKMIMVVEPHPVAGVVGSYAQTASATWKAIDAINSTLLEQSGNSGAGPQVFASDDGVVLADQQALLQGVRSWPRELPCQADDAKVCQKDGSTVVRSADGIHLCPTHNNPIPGGLTCDQRSPGAYRFANSIAATIRAVLSGLPLPHPAPLCRCLD